MSDRPSGRRRDREEAPTRYTLAPLLEAQVFTAGPGRLTCGVGGRDYSAGMLHRVPGAPSNLNIRALYAKAIAEMTVMPDELRVRKRI